MLLLSADKTNFENRQFLPFLSEETNDTKLNKNNIYNIAKKKNKFLCEKQTASALSPRILVKQKNDDQLKRGVIDHLVISACSVEHRERYRLGCHLQQQLHKHH